MIPFSKYMNEFGEIRCNKCYVEVDPYNPFLQWDIPKIGVFCVQCHLCEKVDKNIDAFIGFSHYQWIEWICDQLCIPDALRVYKQNLFLEGCDETSESKNSFLGYNHDQYMEYIYKGLGIPAHLLEEQDNGQK